MKSLIERARTLLTGKSPQDQLAEVRSKIADAAAEISRLDDEIGRRALPILRGDHEAAQVAAELEREKRALAAELVTLRTAEGQLAASVAAEERAEAQAAAARLPGEVAAEVEAVLQLDDQIHQQAAALAATMRDRQARGKSLARLAGGRQLERINQGIAGRICDAIANDFRFDLGAPNTPDRNYLRLVSSLRGERMSMTLRQQDVELFDDEAPYFSTREAAEAAVARLAARKTRSLVHELPGGTFTVIRTDDLYIDRASADRAVEMAYKVGFKLVVHPHKGGFLVRPPRAADAALTTEAAA